MKKLFVLIALFCTLIIPAGALALTVTPTSWGTTLPPGGFAAKTFTLTSTGTESVNVTLTSLPSYVYFDKTHFTVSSGAITTVKAIIAIPSGAPISDYYGNIKFNNVAVPTTIHVSAGGSPSTSKKVYSADLKIGEGVEISWREGVITYSSVIYVLDVKKLDNKVKFEIGKDSTLQEWIPEGSGSTQGVGASWMTLQLPYIVDSSSTYVELYLPSNATNVVTNENTKNLELGTSCDLSIELIPAKGSGLLKVKDAMNNGMNGDAILRGVVTGEILRINIMNGYGTFTIPPGETLLAGTIEIPGCKTIPKEFELGEYGGSTMLELNASITEGTIGDYATFTVKIGSYTIKEAKIKVTGPEAKILDTDENGEARLLLSKEGTFNAVASKSGYTDSASIDIIASQEATENDSSDEPIDNRTRLSIQFWVGNDTIYSTHPGEEVIIKIMNRTLLYPVSATITVESTTTSTTYTPITGGIGFITLEEIGTYTFNLPETSTTKPAAVSLVVQEDTAPSGFIIIGSSTYLAVVVVLLLLVGFVLWRFDLPPFKREGGSRGRGGAEIAHKLPIALEESLEEKG